MDISINMERTLAYASQQRYQQMRGEGGGSSGQLGLLQQQQALVGSVDLSIEIKDGDRSLKLVYQATFAAFSESEALAMGDVPPLAMPEAFDPEHTAQSILDLAASLFDRFGKRHAELAPQDLLAQFMQTIGQGIEQGFAEAREILDGMGVLQGELANQIDRSYELVQGGMPGLLQRLLDQHPSAGERLPSLDAR